MKSYFQIQGDVRSARYVYYNFNTNVIIHQSINQSINQSA